MKIWNRLLSLLLCGVLLLTLAGCRAGSPGNDNAGATTLPSDEETTAPSVSEPEETTIPQEESRASEDPTTEPDDETEPVDVQIPVDDEFSTDPQVVRTQDVSRETVESIIARYAPTMNGDISMVHLTSQDALSLFLAQVNSQMLQDRCDMYGADFFENYDLILIPRVTNTGSVTHTVELHTDGSNLLILLSAESPEIVTMDMANWFIIVPVAKSETADRIISVQMAGGLGNVSSPGKGNLG